MFKGDKNLGSILQDAETYVSFINELELLGFKGITFKEETWVELFLEECIIIDINPGIKEITKQIRRNYALKEMLVNYQQNVTTNYGNTG